MSTSSEFEWIPCKHAMPEGTGLYLTYWSDGTLEIFKFDNESIKDAGWYAPLGGAIITHWEELPSVPV